MLMKKNKVFFILSDLVELNFWERKAMKKKVLIVDDTKSHRDLLRSILLHYGYEIVEAENGKEGFEKALEFLPDIVISDVIMPEMNGFELCRKIKGDKRFEFLPVVLVTASDRIEDKITGLKEGADEFLTKPVVPSELSLRVSNLLKIKDMNEKILNYSKDLEKEVNEKTMELKNALNELTKSNEEILNAQKETIFRLALAGEYKDEDTPVHIKRVSLYVKLISKELSLKDAEIELYEMASTMHDVGKIGIPDRILLKKGKLTNKEYNLMKTHTIIGAQILEASQSSYIQIAHQIAEAHHEKYNGEGYPYGKKGEEIPLCARITTIADVFDALVSRRRYKEKWDISKALQLIESEAGKHFDENVVQAFFNVKDKIIEINYRLNENTMPVERPLSLIWDYKEENS